MIYSALGYTVIVLWTVFFFASSSLPSLIWYSQYLWIPIVIYNSDSTYSDSTRVALLYKYTIYQHLLSLLAIKGMPREWMGHIYGNQLF